MTIESVVSRFKRCRPYSVLDILTDCRVPLQYMGDGAFRNVFHIIGVPLVVKVPKDVDHDEREHAATEIRVYRKVMRNPKYEPIRKYMPEIFYYGYGVTLMREYRPVVYQRDWEQREKASGEIVKALEIGGWDDNHDNFGKDTNGNIVLLDLGCLTPDYANSAEDLS